MLDGGEDMDGQDMDIAIYLETGGVSANLVSNSAKHLPAMDSDDPFAAPGGGEDTLMNIENVKGSHMFDVLIGGGENNVLKGLDGGDRISRGAGNDTIAGGKGNDTVNADNADTTLDGDTGLLAADDEDTADVDEESEGDMDVLSYAGVK